MLNWFAKGTTFIKNFGLCQSAIRLSILGFWVGIVLGILQCSPSQNSPGVVLVGMDGVDPQILQDLADEGRLPHFSTLMEEGAFGTLRSREPLLSPLLWTTVATGRSPQDHGILDFVEADAEGIMIPITGTSRRVPTLWNLAHRNGLSSGFVGWYASFPAESLNGFIVSDRVGFHQNNSKVQAEGAVYPEELESLFPADLTVDLTATREIFLDDPNLPLSEDGASRLARLAEIHATTERYRKAALLLYPRYRPQLFGIYFELVDACSHLFMENTSPFRSGQSTEDYAALRGTVNRCYEYQDEVLGELLTLVDPESYVVVVSDHGFKSGDIRPQTSGRADRGMAGLWHRLHGILALRGPGIQSKTTIEGASIMDIAPTVLAMLHLPLSREMPGHALTELIEPAFRPRLSWVDRYRPQPKRLPMNKIPVANERLSQLRALGYLDGHRAEDGSTWRARPLLHEAVSRAVDGDRLGAERAIQGALTLDPESVSSLLFAARLARDRGESTTSQGYLDQALRLAPNNPFTHLSQSELLLDAGDLKSAQDEWRRAETLDPNLAILQLLGAQLANASNRSQEALERLERAERLTDSLPMLKEILLFKARVAAENGHLDLAEQSLERVKPWTTERDRRVAQGDLSMAKGNWLDAKLHYNTALENQPKQSAIERRLGRAHAALGEYDAAQRNLEASIRHANNPMEAEGAWSDLALTIQMNHGDLATLELLGTAIEKMPQSSSLWGMLGATYGRLGEFDRAIEAYESSWNLDPTAMAGKTLAALIFHHHGDHEGAVHWWRLSYRLDSNQPDVRAFLETHDPEWGTSRAELKNLD